jgi:hypothetical protein
MNPHIGAMRNTKPVGYGPYAKMIPYYLLLYTPQSCIS